MKYEISKAIEVLIRTPEVLRTQLSGLSDEWLHGNEGVETWSPFQVVAHLILNEKTNFLTRTSLIVSNTQIQKLESIDMYSHLEMYKDEPIDRLLAEFSLMRNKNILELERLKISEEDLLRTAIHPKLGEVCLSNILSTWVAHDLIHLGQITRVMGKQYRHAIGPFIEYLPRLK